MFIGNEPDYFPLWGCPNGVPDIHFMQGCHEHDRALTSWTRKVQWREWHDFRFCNTTSVVQRKSPPLLPNDRIAV